MSEIIASPTKTFFTSMLTRDIDLDDAILDLLDNSLDGLLRQEPNKSDTPYDNYKVAITINENEFIIEDNCGGIPTDIAENYAFRMGKPPSREDDEIPTVGMFGIGMKRAIFKMGEDILILSKNDEKCFYVEITPEWLSSDDNWKLDMLDCSDAIDIEEKGTRIVVKDLYKGISKKFSSTSDFISILTRKIETHYALIIKKGLSITINGNAIFGIALMFLGTENIVDGEAMIEPYYYEENNDDVKVRVIVAMTEQSPSIKDIDSESENSLQRNSPAGWTIVCNERVVLYADQTILTGWGDRLPKFHPQFNTIVGVVEFSSNKAGKLPVTTTKRGIDASADLYMRIRKRMIEGMRIYVDYTNKWKNLKEKEREVVISKTKAKSINEMLDSHGIADKTNTVKDGSGGKQYKPKLPLPPTAEPTTRFIRFSKLISDIEVVSEHLFDDPSFRPEEVGEACFEKVLKEANS